MSDQFVPDKVKLLLKMEESGRLNPEGSAVLEKIRARGLLPAASRNIAEEGLRKAEYASRGFTDAALDAVGAIPDMVASGTNAIGLTDLPENYYSDTLKSGFRSAGETMSAPLNALAPDAMSGPMTTADKTAYGAGEGAGQAVSFLAPAAAAAKAPGLIGNVGKVASSQPVMQTAAGAVGGAVGEATDSDLMGLGAAMLTPGVKGIPQMARGAMDASKAKSAIIKNAPSQESLKAAGNAAYKKASEISGKVRPESFSALLDDLDNIAMKEGAAEGLTPKVFGALKAARSRVGEMGVDDLEIVRRQLGMAIDPMDKNQSRIAMKLRDRLDDYVQNIGADDLADGSMDGAAAALKDARAIWSKNRKTEIIEEIMEKAQTQASGHENGLRIGFRALLNNKKKMAGFTDDERQAIKEVAEGTPTRNAMRLLGKFGFDFQANTNALGAILGGGAGYGAGGPLGAVALPAVGSAARYGSDKLTSRSAELARALAATGGQMPKSGMPQINRELLAKILTAQGAQ
jgi:hypothetical protein